MPAIRSIPLWLLGAVLLVAAACSQATTLTPAQEEAAWRACQQRFGQAIVKWRVLEAIYPGHIGGIPDPEWVRVRECLAEHGLRYPGW